MEDTCALLPGGYYRVEKVLGISVDKDNTRSFKIHWLPTWVSEKNLVGCDQMITEFLDEQQKVQKNQEPNTSCVSDPVKVEGENGTHVISDRYKTSCNEDVHIHFNKTFSSQKDGKNTSTPLTTEISSRNDIPVENEMDNMVSPNEKQQVQQQPQQQQQPQHISPSEPLPYSLHQLQPIAKDSTSIDNCLQYQPDRYQIVQQQQQQQQQQPFSLQQQHHQLQQQQSGQQTHELLHHQQPSYDFLFSFYNENAEYVKSCKLKEICERPHPTPLSMMNYEEEDIFQPYTGGHSVFLRVVNNIIEHRDLMSTGNNKVDRIKAVEEIMLTLGIRNTHENTQRISKRLSKLITSKKHAVKIKKSAAELGISYNRYRSCYAKRKSGNRLDNESGVSKISSVTSNNASSQDDENT